MELKRLQADALDALRPAWLALCEHLGGLQTRMGQLRPPDELWARRRDRYERWLRRAPSAVFVAREGDGLLGYAMVQARDPWNLRQTSDPAADLQTLSVMPGARGRGVGAALLRAAEAHLREHGVRDLTVGVSTANAGALRMYEREGFRPLTSTYWAAPVPACEAPRVPVEVVAPDDVDSLLPLWTQLSDHHEEVRPRYLPQRRPPEEQFARMRAEMTREDAFLLRAPGGYVHGFVGGGFDVWDTGRVGAIQTLVVDRDARGRGTGAALLAAAAEVLRTRQAKGIELDVLEGNDRARRFYERTGLSREFESLYKALT